MPRILRVVTTALALALLVAAPAGAGGPITDANEGLLGGEAITHWGLMPIPGAALALPTQPECSRFRHAKIVAGKFQIGYAFEAAQNADGSRRLVESARLFPDTKHAAQFVDTFKLTKRYELCLRAQYTLGSGMSNVTVSRLDLRIKHADAVVAYRVDATYPDLTPRHDVSAIVVFGRYEKLVSDLSFRADTGGFAADQKYVVAEVRQRIAILG